MPIMPGNSLGEPERGGSLDVYAGASGHVVEHHRQRGSHGHFAVMKVQALLRGLVIERCHREDG